MTAQGHCDVLRRMSQCRGSATIFIPLRSIGCTSTNAISASGRTAPQSLSPLERILKALLSSTIAHSRTRSPGPAIGDIPPSSIGAGVATENCGLLNRTPTGTRYSTRRSRFRAGGFASCRPSRLERAERASREAGASLSDVHLVKAAPGRL